MPRLSTALRRAAMLIPVLTCLDACSPCTCINDCVRQYELRTQEGMGGVRIDNVSEAAKECELDARPRAIPDGERVFVGRVVAVQPDGPTAHSYRIFLEQHLDAGAAPSTCQARRLFRSVDELTPVALPPGTELCVVGQVKLERICTQKSCGS